MEFLFTFLVNFGVAKPVEEKVEAGERMSGRTDCDPGEGELGEGEGVQGRGDRTGGPVGEGLLDQEASGGEPGQDRGQPEDSGEVPGLGNVGEAVHGGGLEELPHGLHQRVVGGAGLSDLQPRVRPRGISTRFSGISSEYTELQNSQNV